MANKYVTTEINGIVMTISKKTEVEGYFESVIFCNLPDDINMTRKDELNWIRVNNVRMASICQFMNENNL